MKSLTTSRLIAVFLFAIACSAAAGASVMRAWMLRQAEHQRPQLLAERFQKHLSLSDAQTGQVSTLIEAMMNGMRNAPSGDLAAVAASKREFVTGLRAILSADQRSRYDAFLASSSPEPTAP